MKSLSEEYLNCDRRMLKHDVSTLYLLKNGSSLTKVLKFYYYNEYLHKPEFITDTHRIAPAKQWVKDIQNGQNLLMNANYTTSDPSYAKKIRDCGEKMFVAQAHSKTALYFYADYNIEMMNSDPKFILVTKSFVAKHLMDLIKLEQKKIIGDKKDIIREHKSKPVSKPTKKLDLSPDKLPF